jgi:hypothetical protein
MRNLDLEFSEEFREKSDDIEGVESTLELIEDRCEELQKMDRGLKIDVDWTEKDFFIKNKNGVHGRTKSREKIEILLNTDIEDWKDMLKNQFTHEYGHTYFFEVTGFKYESNIENWRHLLLEAHGQHFSEKAYPEINAYWRENVSRQNIAERWSDLRPLLSEKIFSSKIVGSRDYPLFFGYSMAYYIGEDLIKEHKLKRFPKLEKQHVIESGDQIFNKD